MRPDEPVVPEGGEEDSWPAFFHRLVEELKTPVSKLATLSELMESGGVADDRSRERFSTSLRYLTLQVQVLVDDAASLLRLARGTPAFDLQEIELSRFLEDLEIRGRRQAWQRDVSFRFEAEPGLPATLRTDPGLLLDGLLHLLDTAASFADAELTLHVVRCERDVVFRVEPDRGCCSAESLEFMLQPFDGAPARRLRERGGRALALLKAREMARILGGDLAFGRAERSSCEFRIPLAPPRPSSQC